MTSRRGFFRRVAVALAASALARIAPVAALPTVTVTATTTSAYGVLLHRKKMQMARDFFDTWNETLWAAPPEPTEPEPYSLRSPSE